MMPLGMANVGDVNVIEKITGRDEVRAHLAELGFVVGAQVKVVSEMGGNLILSVKDSRIALDKTMAMCGLSFMCFFGASRCFASHAVLRPEPTPQAAGSMPLFALRNGRKCGLAQ